MKKILLIMAVFAGFLGACKSSNDEYIPKPQGPAIQKITPNIGLDNDVVTLAGNRFSKNVSDIVVKFSGVKAEVLSASDTLLTVKVPVGGSTGIVTITVNSRTSNGPSFTYGTPSTELDPDGNEIQYEYITSTYAGIPKSQGDVLGDLSVAKFMLPNGVSFDPTTGDLIVADRSAHAIKRISKEGIVTKIAGTGTSGRVNGDLLVATFANPYKTAVDKFGNIYVADNGNNQVRKIDLGAGTVTTLAGSATGTSGYTDGIGSAALFNVPTGIAVDDDLNVYVADAANHVVRKITQDGRVSTLAGIAATPGIADGKWPNVTLNRPTAVAMGKDGFLYAADRYGQRVRKINVKTGETVTIAGSGGSAAASGGHVDGDALSARFNNIWGIDVDNDGVIYVSELEGTAGKSHAVRMIKKGKVSTIAGPDAFADPGHVDGVAGVSRFSNPADVACDDLGNIFVGDQSNYVIRKIVKVRK